MQLSVQARVCMLGGHVHAGGCGWDKAGKQLRAHATLQPPSCIVRQPHALTLGMPIILRAPLMHP